MIMGRKPKTVNASNPQDILICPVCGKEFQKDGNTKFTINREYTCSWKCFRDEVNRHEAMKQEAIKNGEIKKRKR